MKSFFKYESYHFFLASIHVMTVYAVPIDAFNRNSASGRGKKIELVKVHH